jgi:hypothetical protein
VWSSERNRRTSSRTDRRTYAEAAEGVRKARYSRRLATVPILLALAACNAPIKQYELKDQPLTCDDANRLSYRTLEAMRFRVSEFQPAAPGQRGTITASRSASGDSQETQGATVTIDCTPTGADIDASEDGAFLNQMEFKRAFNHAFVNVVSMHASRQQLDQQILAGTAPASQQRGDLKVVVEPKPGAAAKLDFAFDLAAAGVLPVWVAITNLTPRTYTLDVSAIRLVRSDRERVAALDPDAAAARVAGARRAGSAEPLTAVPRDAIAGALAVRQLAASEIAPSVECEGFLYFPLADYRSARVVLTDKETGEDEGVRVEF